MDSTLVADSDQPARRKPPAAGKGRPKGALNKATVAVRDAATRLVEDPHYRATLAARLRTGRCNPAVETMLWHYAYGKPKETVEHQGGLDVVTAIERVIIRGADAQD